MSQGNPTQHEIDVYCAEWILNGGDQSKAWRKAYPKSTMNEDGLWVAASKMHKMHKVQLRLVELQAIIAEKDAEEFDMSVSEIKKYLKDIADIGTGRKVPDGVLKALKLEDEEEISPEILAGLCSKLNLGAAASAIGEINRMNGNHAAQKINASVVTMTHEEWLANLDD